MNFQILIVAKHYAQYYMIPSFILVSFTLFISSLIIYEHLKYYYVNVRLNYIIISLIIFISAFSLYKIIYSYYEGEGQRKEAEDIVNLVNTKYSDNLVISGFGSANYDCALTFAVQYAAGQEEYYNNILYRNQKSHIFYNPWINRIYIPDDKDEFKKLIRDNKKFILQLNNFGSVEKFTGILESTFGKKIISVKQIFTNGNSESLYEINTD